MEEEIIQEGYRDTVLFSMVSHFKNILDFETDSSYILAVIFGHMC